MNDRFEKELQGAMRRVDAPGALMAKLMTQATADQRAAQQGRRILAFKPRTAVLSRGLQTWGAGLIAAGLAVGVFTFEGVKQHRERAQAEREFAQAQQVEARTLEHVREQLERAGVQVSQ